MKERLPWLSTDVGAIFCGLSVIYCLVSYFKGGTSFEYVVISLLLFIAASLGSMTARLTKIAFELEIKNDKDD